MRFFVFIFLGALLVELAVGAEKLGIPGSGIHTRAECGLELADAAPSEALSSKEFRILYFFPSDYSVEAANKTLEDAGYSVKFAHARNINEFKHAVSYLRFDAILSDYRGSDTAARVALEKLGELRKQLRRRFDLPLIVVAPEAPAGIAIDLIKKGAFYYLPDEHLKHLPSILESASQEREKRRIALRERRARKDEQERQILLGQLLFTAAHELNNAFTPIEGGLELMRDLGSLNPAALQFLNMASSSAQLAGGIVRNLITYAKNDAPLPRVVDLEKKLFRNAPVLKMLAGRNIRFVLDHKNDPRITYPVFGDPTEILQALMNITKNGVDAMPDGGTLTIRLTRATSEDDEQIRKLKNSREPYARIDISDTGTGIPPEIQNKIFTAFFTTKGRNGSGIGLHQVAQTIKRRRGFLAFKTEQNVGTTFSIYLPIHRENAEAAPVVNPGPVQIMIVEDEAPVRELTRRLLSRMGNVIIEAASGEEAIKLFTNNPGISLVIIDLNLPHLNGMDTLREMRKLNPKLPAIACTGSGGEKAEAWLQSRDPEIEVQGSIGKPFPFGDLRRMVNEALGIDEE